jgi:DNA polymerase V
MKIIETQKCNVVIRRELSLFLSPIRAGFPSPADDYLDKKLDLNEHLIKHPASTFFVKVKGDSMINASIRSGDILIVDRSLEPKDKSVVVAVVNGEFTVKRIRKRGNKLFLDPENDSYIPIEITDEMDFEIWGIVIHVIHSLRP